MPEAMIAAREGKGPRRDDPLAAEGVPSAPFIVDGAEEDEHLRTSSRLSREELLRRRCRLMKQLYRIYRRCYWSMMEEIREKHRRYYWENGVSPIVGEEEVGGEKGPEAEANGGGVAGADGSEARLGLGVGEGGGMKSKRKRCAFAGCKTKAMPLTSFCHAHILGDKKQTLYKPCSCLTRSSGPGGPITCGKPILRSAMPSLCPVHLQKHQKSVTKAFRKAGITLSSPGRPVSAYRLFVYNCLLHIREKINRIDLKDETANSKDEIC